MKLVQMNRVSETRLSTPTGETVVNNRYLSRAHRNGNEQSAPISCEIGGHLRRNIATSIEDEASTIESAIDQFLNQISIINSAAFTDSKPPGCQAEIQLASIKYRFLRR